MEEINEKQIGEPGCIEE